MIEYKERSHPKNIRKINYDGSVKKGCGMRISRFYGYTSKLIMEYSLTI